MDVLPHVGDICRLLRQRHVKLARDAVGQLNVTRDRKYASQ
jgi:hypothetical protein